MRPLENNPKTGSNKGLKREAELALPALAG
jgi:hypothetical protein